MDCITFVNYEQIRSNIGFGVHPGGLYHSAKVSFTLLILSKPGESKLHRPYKNAS